MEMEKNSVTTDPTRNRKGWMMELVDMRALKALSHEE